MGDSPEVTYSAIDLAGSLDARQLTITNRRSVGMQVWILVFRNVVHPGVASETQGAQRDFSLTAAT